MTAPSFARILVARRLPEYDCWADDGEWLVPADEAAIAAFRLPPGAHFFRGLASGRGARYGFVAEAEAPVDPERLVPPLDDARALAFLRTVAKHPPGTVMAVSWKSTYGTPIKRRRHLTVHRATLGPPKTVPGGRL